MPLKLFLIKKIVKKYTEKCERGKIFQANMK